MQNATRIDDGQAAEAQGEKPVILLAIVGDRDPDWTFIDREAGTSATEEGPLCFYLRTVLSSDAGPAPAPTQVYLLHTTDGDRADRADDLILRCRAWGIRAEKRELSAKPTHWRQLLKSMGSIAEQVRAEHPGARITVLTNPGTPQMLAAWLVLGNEGRLPAEFYRQDEKRFGGTVERIQFEPLFEVEYQRRAIALMRHFRFDAAAELYKELGANSYHAPRRNSAFVAQILCRIWADCERFDFAQALTGVKFARNHPNFRAGRFPPYLQRCTETLQNLDRVRPALEDTTLNWLWAADRALRNGRHMDCIWRCTTAYEVMLRMTLRNKNLPYWEEGNVRQCEERLLGNDPDIPVGRNRVTVNAAPYLPAHPGMLRFAEIKVPVPGRSPVSLRLALREAQDVRNKLLHNGRVKGDAAAVEAALTATATAVQAYFDRTRDQSEAFPFSFYSIDAVMTDIEAEFGQSSP